MTKYYSLTTKGFYDDAVNKNKPEDCLTISDDKYSELLNGQSEGQEIVYIDDEIMLKPSQCCDWDGSKWVNNSQKELPILKKQKFELVNIKYDEVIEAGYKFGEYNFYCSSTTLAKLDVSVRNVERVVAKGDTPTTTQLSYYDRNKNLCTFADADEFIAFIIGYTDHIDAIDKNRVVLSSAIASAETKEVLENIDITTGWS